MCGRYYIDESVENDIKRLVRQLDHQMRHHPAGKFYEWNREKQKVTFLYPSSPSIYMAGFYRMDGDGPHFVILTTAANVSMSPVHDRMPLILEEQNISRWIFEDDQVKEILGTPSPMLDRQQDYEQFTLF